MDREFFVENQEKNSLKLCFEHIVTAGVGVLGVVSSSGFRHRHQDDHKCEKLEIPKPRMAATQELVQKIVG